LPVVDAQVAQVAPENKEEEQPADRAAECPRCRRLLATMPRGAKFCPKCGSDLSAEPAADAQPPLAAEALEQSVGAKVQAFFKSAAAPNADDLHASFGELQSIIRGYGKDDLPPTLENVHSLILLGYANALLKLGWRYEHGQGVLRNKEEADRCYQKSAKLGNVFARAKISGQ
jgi:hypothetical protein